VASSARLTEAPASLAESRRARQADTWPASKYLTVKDDKLFINLAVGVNGEILAKLKEILTKNSGDKKVFFKLNSGLSTGQAGVTANLVETDFKVKYGQVLTEEINKILKN
jgi:hypothetical protein